jgi:hypothetical protein
MEIVLEEHEASGYPMILDGSVEVVLAIIQQHDARLWFSIVCPVIEELMRSGYFNADSVEEAIRDSLWNAEIDAEVDA